MPKFDLKKAYESKQAELSSMLRVTLDFSRHPTVIGDASEVNWAAMLRDFLPNRYGIGPVIAVDANGDQSEQIDIAIFDQQYSPLWFKSRGEVRLVPVESIYAAFEVKQEFSTQNIKYAAQKVASIRGLHRTSAEIMTAGGRLARQDISTKPILGGLLALRTGWAKGTNSPAAWKALDEQTGTGFLDLGLCLEDLSFDRRESPSRLTVSHPGTQLIFFAMHLFKRLQEIGTVLALDLNEYERVLDPYSENDETPQQR